MLGNGKFRLPSATDSVAGAGVPPGADGHSADGSG